MNTQKFKSALMICALSLVSGGVISACSNDPNEPEEEITYNCGESNCSEDQTCISNKCYDNKVLCGKDGGPYIQCTANEICDKEVGRCIQNACDYDNPDCPDGYECSEDRVCVLIHVEETCDGENPVPCQEGYKCDTTTHQCVIKNPCDSIKCLSGQVCVPDLLTCLETECVENGKEKQCPEGQMCSKGECIDNGCADVKCDSGWQCSRGICEETACIGVVCKDGRTCVAGNCVDNECLSVTCDYSYACSKGECIPSKCVDVTCDRGRVCEKDGSCAFADPVALVVGEVTDKITDENGKQVSISVSLNHEPASEVHLDCEISNAAEASAACESIVFNADNWNIPQTVIVTGLADHIVDTDKSYSLTMTTDSKVGCASPAPEDGDEEGKTDKSDDETDKSGDKTDPSEPIDEKQCNDSKDFDELKATINDMSNLNVDTAVYVVAPEGKISVDENGSKTFTIALSSIPTSDVVISVSSSDPTIGTVDVTNITFTPENWNQPQTVTISGVNNNEMDGNKEFKINLEATTSDENFAKSALNAIDVIRIDDDKPNVKVSSYNITTIEGNNEVSIYVMLSIPPEAGKTVTVSLSIDDNTEAAIGQGYLTFTADNWNQAQEVTVHGLKDDIYDGDQSYHLTLTPASKGGMYADVEPIVINGTNIDIDTYGFVTTLLNSPIVHETDSTTGSTFDVKVKLASIPTGDVKASVKVSDDSELVIMDGDKKVTSQELTFTSAKWNEYQTITVAGVDDIKVDGDVLSQLTITASSTDQYFDAEKEEADKSGNKKNVSKTTFTTVDDDVAQIIVNSQVPYDKNTNPIVEDVCGNVDKCEVVKIELSLAAQPDKDVKISALSSAKKFEILSGNSVVFTPDNWNIPQIVKVTVIDDIYAGENINATISFTSSSEDSVFNGLKATSPIYEIVDNESANIVITADPMLLNQQTGVDKSQISVKLTGKPQKNVTVMLSTTHPLGMTLSATELTFTPDNYNEAQTFDATTNFNMPSPKSVTTITGIGKGDAYEQMIRNVDITVITNNYKPEEVFTYTGSVQATTLTPGYYKFEVWGAQGGFREDTADVGAKGGYSVGTIHIEEETTAYIYVGGKGTAGWGNISPIAGGFNGGGNAVKYNWGRASGGGATDIRLGTDSLFSRVIVAGGGGGSAGTTSNMTQARTGGYGGGATGGTNAQSISGIAGSIYNGGGGTQTDGGTNSTNVSLKGQFGLGGNYTDTEAGGGGGWYGGAAGNPGGGGSGYVYTSSSAANYPAGCLLNNSYYLTNTQMIAGNASFPAPDGGQEVGHPGNGYVRITGASGN